MGNMDFHLFNFAYVLYTISAILYLLYAFTKNKILARNAFFLTTSAVIIHLAVIVLRAYLRHAEYQVTWYALCTNRFEIISFFVFAAGAIFLALQILYGMIYPVVFVMPLLWIILNFSLAYPLLIGSGGNGFWNAVNVSRAISNPAPAFQSLWMIFLPPVMVLAFSAFAMAFALGIVYIIRERNYKYGKPAELPGDAIDAKTLDDVIYKLISFGFMALTLGIVLYSRWSYDARGRYWVWKAEEIGMFITWITYLIYLHARLVMERRGKMSVLTAMVCFGVGVIACICRA